jgi:integrase
VTWYRHAVAYAEMKWPHLAPHSRASLADALATVTSLLTRETGRRPPAQTLRAALYGHAFNARRRSGAPAPDTASALAWVERASLPVSQLSDPRVIRAALDGLCTRLDGSPAAASTITRKRAMFHDAVGYAVELGLLPANPAGLVRWRAPRTAVAVSPATVPSPAQVEVILAEVARIRPELSAFIGCLYYAALRPEEAVALRRDDLILPARGRGTIILTAACPRTGSAWTSTGTPFGPRGLKRRPGGTIRVVPIPPVLVRMLRQHLHAFGTAPTGGCSAAPAAACSANRSTAAPGTPPARPPSARTWPPPRWPAAPMTCGTPPCRCGSTPVARPPRSPRMVNIRLRPG